MCASGEAFPNVVAGVAGVDAVGGKRLVFSTHAHILCMCMYRCVCVCNVCLRGSGRCWS